MRTKTPLGIDVFYDGDWHAVAPEVWSREPVEVSRGRSSETKRVRPTAVTALFGNNDRKWSPRRPQSELYGKIGPATPMRLYTTLFSDTFGRTVASGWGTATDSTAKATGRVDRTWDTVTVGSGSTSVGSGVGVHTQTTTVGYRLSVLADVAANAWRDCEVRTQFIPQLSDVTGASIQPGNLVLRYVDSSNYYLARVQITTAEAVTISIIKLEANVETGLTGAITVSGLTFAGQPLAVAFLAEGPVLAAKVWDPATGEPYDFQATAVDDTFPSAGQVGVRTGVPASNTNVPVTVHHDNLEVRSPEAFVDVKAWPQRQSLDGKDRSVPIRAYGVMDRLLTSGTGTDAKSALRRWFEQASPQPVLYWPLEETSSAFYAESGLAEFLALHFSGPLRAGNTLAPFGAASAISAVGGFASATAGAGRGGYGTAEVQLTAAPAAMVFDFHLAANLIAPVTTAADEIEIRPFNLFNGTTGSQVLFIIDTSTDNFTVSIFTLAGGTDNAVFTSATAVATAVDGRPHNFRILLQDNGANLDVTLLMDGATVGTTTVGNQIPDFSAGTLVVPEMARRSGAGTPVEDIEVTISHFALWLDASAPSAYEAGTGFDGEQAHVRMARLCAEEGIPFQSSPGDTALLGPQRTIPPLESIDEAAEVDGGILLEPRGRPGLFYRTHASMYNLPATYEADFTAGDEVRSPSEPSEDLDFVANDVTVRRRLGGESTVTKTSGPRNVNDPTTDPEGVGRRQPPAAELSLHDADQTLQQAAWRVSVGTADDPRYPALGLSPSMLHVPGKTTELNQVADLDIGDRATLTEPTSGAPSEEQQVQGTYSTFESHRWLKEAVTSPSSPWLIGTVGGPARLDNPGCTTQEPLDTTETGVDVLSVNIWWSDNTPYDIVIAGERMTVTAVSTAASSVQTLTVTRSVNGVVKEHPVGGVPVHVAEPLRLARGA